MSVGKNSIKRAVSSKSAPAQIVPTVEGEVMGAAPELANSCVAPAKKPAAKKPAAKPAAKKPAAKKPAAKPAAKKPAAKKPAAKPALKAEAPAVTPVAAPAKEAESAVSVTQELPYWLL